MRWQYNCHRVILSLYESRLWLEFSGPLGYVKEQVIRPYLVWGVFGIRLILWIRATIAYTALLS